jgi:Domain of Unknown Function with PDB structure (DUF3857)/Transglutaminase-like superfamily
MNLSLRKHSVMLFLSFLLLINLQVVFAGDNVWREVTPAELQMKTSKVEPNADAEAIFWEVRVDDSNPESLVMKHYIRVKIFTERGREKYSKVDIPFVKGMRIKDIMARVIKADGTIVELAKTDIFEREIAKANDVKIKAKSFAVPNIEPGVIVEYQYKEVTEGSANNMRMTFQHDIPIENISYYFKPYNNTKYLTFNMSDNKFIKDKNGFYRAGMENVPAIKEEPRMPPEDEVRSWLLLYYTDDLKGDSDDFWSRAGGFIVRTWDIKDTLKPGKDLKAAAEQIAAGANSPEEKLAKVYEFCKTKIKNITYDTKMTDEEKDALKPNKSTGDTYKKMQGVSTDINELFASLSTALGFETRLAFGGDRSKMFFNPRQAHVSFIHFSSIGVKVNNQWRYYDPGDLFTPAGMLPWFEEDTAVLLLGYKDYLKTATPLSDPESSLGKRTGKFKLLEDGTLEGTVSQEYTGHLAYIYKMNNYDDSVAKQEETLKDAIKEKMSAAEVSNITIGNVNDPEKPFVYNYKIRIPNYAQRTGKRLFLQPGFFEYGESPMFSTATRKYDIAFNYPWSEADDVEIELPAGFELDNADAPADIADPSKISSLKINIAITKDGKSLKYKRNFYFGGGSKILFPVTAYEPLKGLFDAFHKSDSHTITLKQK